MNADTITDEELMVLRQQGDFGADMLIKAAEQKLRADKAEAEAIEQARLLGMSAEREADALGKIDRLERELNEAKAENANLIRESLRLKEDLTDAEIENVELHKRLSDEEVTLQRLRALYM